jgi:hypothetical protein
VKPGTAAAAPRFFCTTWLQEYEVLSSLEGIFRQAFRKAFQAMMFVLNFEHSNSTNWHMEFEPANQPL